MRESYQIQLQNLNSDLVELAAKVQLSVQRASKALLEADLELAQEVIQADDEIDAMRESIEHEAITILATQAPVATDLRQIVMALRVVADLERSGDMSVGIAKIARRSAPRSVLGDLSRAPFEKMAQITDEMTGKTKHVLENHDVEVALSLETQDDELDILHAQVFKDLIDISPKTEAAIDIANVGRLYERIGDHAVSIAARVVFFVTGQYPTAQ